jgi:DNA primase small subunit
MRGAERPEKCAKCQGPNTTQLHWSCPICLAAAKEHVSRLIRFLTEDFGVTGEISVFFSGNRGFHLHVDDERFKPMDQAARAEVANYIRGVGLVAPQETDGGWSKRFASTKDRKVGQVVEAFGSDIDESVTTDVHRIFRMPGTLHGNSGLLKMRVHDLARFRPDYDPVVLGDDEITLHVSGSPSFGLKGRTFRAYSEEEATLPTYAAVYLMTKGLARLAG